MLLLEDLEASLDDLTEEESFILKSISGTFGEEKKKKKELCFITNHSYESVNKTYNNAIEKLKKAI